MLLKREGHVWAGMSIQIPSTELGHMPQKATHTPAHNHLMFTLARGKRNTVTFIGVHTFAKRLIGNKLYN